MLQKTEVDFHDVFVTHKCRSGAMVEGMPLTFHLCDPRFNPRTNIYLELIWVPCSLAIVTAMTSLCCHKVNEK
jgi:hypothetical protein